MSVQQNKDTAVKFLHDLEHHDAAKIAAMIADDFKYELMTRMQGAAPMDRKQVVETFLPMLKQSAPEGFNFKIHGVIGEGDHVAVQAESNTRAGNGKKIREPLSFLFPLQGRQASGGP